MGVERTIVEAMVVKAVEIVDCRLLVKVLDGLFGDPERLGDPFQSFGLQRLALFNVGNALLADAQFLGKCLLLHSAQFTNAGNFMVYS